METASTRFGSDRWLMERALQYAEFGLGTVAPNPSVGAVIFDPVSRQVVGAGWTQQGGRPHAEPVAIDFAGGASRGATMAVTLEPCVHYGRSPPCTDAIIAGGIARVIYAVPDPDPRVAGKGAAALQAAGIVVERCDRDLTERARWITRGHILRVTERRPFVQVKIATDDAGEIVPGQGRTGYARPVWVTGPLARASGHVLRAKADAIAVGTGTVADDDPDLTCRLPGCARRSPIRVVIGNRPLGAYTRLARTAGQVPVIQYVGRPPRDTTGHREELPPPAPAGDVERVPVATVGGNIWLPAVMEDLVQRGITRLLLEGGPSLWRSFAAAHLVDEVVLFSAAHRANQSSRVSSVDRAEGIVARYLAGPSFEVSDYRTLGPDTMVTFRNRRFGSPPANRLGASKDVRT